MNERDNRPPKLAGGIFVAIGMLGGAVIGVFMDQPSAGMVIGFGLGLAAAAITWLIDSRRT